MSYSVGREGDVTVVEVDGELVAGNRGTFKDGVQERLADGDRKFLVDFERAGYIDSSGLGVLVSLSKQIRQEGGELRICGLDEDLRTLFELTRLDTVFDITDDRGTALDDF